MLALCQDQAEEDGSPNQFRFLRRVARSESPAMPKTVGKALIVIGDVSKTLGILDPRDRLQEAAGYPAGRQDL
jgi:hypothetical protein